MNNFLRNLTSRALNVENDIRPRLPSLFEPTAPLLSTAPPGRVPPFDEEHALIATARDEDAAVRHPFSTPVDSRLSDITVQDDDRTGSRSLHPNSKWSGATPDSTHHIAQFDDALDIPTFPQRRRVLAKATLSLEREAASPETIAPAVVTPVPIIKSRRSSSDEDPVRNIDVEANETKETWSRAVRSQTDRQLHDKWDDRNRLSNDETGSLRSKSVPMPQSPRLDPQRSDRQPSRRQIVSESPAVEKVINVTIGRIEVRAIPAAQPARSRSENRAVPTTSLDEYLRQRGASDRGGAA